MKIKILEVYLEGVDKRTISVVTKTAQGEDISTRDQGFEVVTPSSAALDIHAHVEEVLKDIQWQAWVNTLVR